MASIPEQVKSLIEKAEVYDPVLAAADPAIMTSRTIPYEELTDIDLEDMYQYNYPQNVPWLIQIRKDFIERKHPEELY